VMRSDERRALLRQVEDLIARAPETAGRATVPVPYVTHVHRYRRP
jgi:hypothetical protein